MGRFSIRLKITIWFTAALVVIVLFAYLMIFVVSRQILIKMWMRLNIFLGWMKSVQMRILII